MPKKKTIYGEAGNTQWFDFADGSNPYGVWGNRLDEFFRMIAAWQPTIKGNRSYHCPKEPTPAYYSKQPYQFYKNALSEFAKEWQRTFEIYDYDTADLAWWGNFFTIYGKKYGLLTEFRTNGII